MSQATPTFSIHSLSEGIDFFRAFVKNWKEVGWPLQTSRVASKKICDAINFQGARHVVEIGAGTGAVTREILKCLRGDGQLIVFEINGVCVGICEGLKTRVLLFTTSQVLTFPKI